MDATLAQCKTISKALRILEEEAQKGDDVSFQFLQRCVWPWITWPMEMLVALEEASFEYVPKERVYKPVVKYNTSFSSTWSIELGIGVEKARWKTRAMKSAEIENCGMA